MISGSEKGMICPIDMEYSETFREYAFIAVMLPSVNRNQHYLYSPRDHLKSKRGLKMNLQIEWNWSGQIQ